MAKKNNWKETKEIILASVILGFVFGAAYNSGEVFNKFLWIKNYLQQVFLSLFFLFIFAKTTKSYALTKGVKTTFSIWNSKRFGFPKGAVLQKTSIQWGIILPLFIALFSKGKLFFSGIISPEFTTLPKKRIGKKYAEPTEKETANIAIIGPMVLTLLAILLSSIKNPDLNNLTLIPFSIAFCTMLPFPKLNGLITYIYGPVKYVFVMVFIISAFYLIKVLTPIQSLIFGLISALIILALNYIISFAKD
ncbi:hypothetical protein HN992_03775 [Candidatus Woesearchaeota archaeon]|jgi:hypothetical protein|nr:hypothetical protein [Candidatus Woesearchaeota archaeon]MBT3438432.1 hypothetical protein [Candidatus Woesearchaeota archaeon]MBT4058102.1 hypothetical protein [Candidatus Woesearchaeota archaeon]MBT4208996.1 hypothetical protein [Candidatus Woesearchaeota archaeon]MBT4731711.1 hypothetical protein [Candidatus Woesearchaeota archaeon]